MSLAKVLAENGSTILGSIPKPRIEAIMRFCQNPAPTNKDWADIRTIIIEGVSMTTVWQAVRNIERRAQFRDFTPDPVTVARAVRACLSSSG